MQHVISNNQDVVCYAVCRPRTGVTWTVAPSKCWLHHPTISVYSMQALHNCHNHAEHTWQSVVKLIVVSCCCTVTLLHCLQAKDGSELDGRAIKVLITSKEASKFEAAATAKDGGGSSGSNGGSSVSRRLGGKAAFALQVFNLAWEVTDADLVEHFQECPVSGA